MEAAVETHDRSRQKRPKSQRGIVEQLTGFWITVQKNLETAIEAKAIDKVGADSAAYRVRCLEKLERHSSACNGMAQQRPARPPPTISTSSFAIAALLRFIDRMSIERLATHPEGRA